MESFNTNSIKILEEALTFEDVLLIPSYSEVLPREVNVTTQFTTDIRLNAPIVSAAMDSVTEYRLAIAIAREGGIGIIHKNMSIQAQAEQVRKVKRSESGMILDPVVLKPDSLVKDAHHLMKIHKIGGIPVIDNQNTLVGILTNRDLRFETDMGKPVSEIMTREKLITAPQGTTLMQAKEILQQFKIEKLPVIDANYKLVGLITYKDIMKIENYPNSSKDNHGRLLVGAAVGVTHDMLDRVSALVEVDVDVVTVDTAHGHSKGVLDAIYNLRKAFPYLQIVGGNVATGEGARALADAGANAHHPQHQTRIFLAHQYAGNFDERHFVETLYQCHHGPSIPPHLQPICR